MNSNTFNFKRFGSYFASDARNCVANFGLSAILISCAGVMTYLAVTLFNLIFNGEWVSTGQALRLFVFCMAMIVMVTSMPVKCYGRLTEKRAGSSWLMIPASKTEKFASMVILNCIAIPLIIATAYLLLDLIICTIDPSCGESLVFGLRELWFTVMETSIDSGEISVMLPDMEKFVHQVGNPLLYMDDTIMLMLIFLLGAIIFKNAKTSKTILAFIVISTILGMLCLPLVRILFEGFTNNIHTMDATQLNELFKTWPFRHIVLMDTISDTIVNIILLACIYHRIKTLKH